MGHWRSSTRIGVLSLAWLVLLLLPVACRPEQMSTPARPAVFDGERAYDLVAEQTEFGFRPSGSPANRATGDWIVEQLQAAGWEVETEEFPYRGVTCRNIIGNR